MAHILLLESDTVLAKIYQQALQRQGYRVTWSAGAQDAIHIVDADQPDVVILELQLAHHNGIEFLYELRSYPDWQDIPVIIQSLVKPTVHPAWEPLGVRAYLYKSQTSLAQLQQAVNRLLSAKIGA